MKKIILISAVLAAVALASCNVTLWVHFGYFFVLLREK
jgi:hypothetical protein